MPDDDQPTRQHGTDGIVEASNGFYQLLDYDGPPDILPDARVSNGLVAVGSTGANILTAFTFGPVALRLETHTAAPPPDSGSWDLIVEVDQHTPSGIVTITSPMLGTAEGFAPYHTSPDSWYTIRVHARGRAIARTFDTVTEEPVEYHLVQLWPSVRPEDETEAWDPRRRRYRVLLDIS